MRQNQQSGIADSALLIDVHPIGKCSNCAKDSTGEQKQLLCSACKFVSYCSRDCQKEHWPKHKKCCNLLIEKKQKAKESGHGREDRLLEQWKDKLRESPLTGLVNALFPMKSLRGLAKTNSFIYITVEFDYNKQTFILTDPPPRIVHPKQVSGGRQRHIANNVGLIYQAMERERADMVKKGYANVNVLMTVKGLRSNKEGVLETWMQFTTSGGGPDTARLAAAKNIDDVSTKVKDEAIKSFNGIRLTSRKFDSWRSRQDKNIDKQLDVLEKHPSLQSLLFYALRIKSSSDDEDKSLHHQNNNNTLVLMMEFGRGLGEIKRLKGYEIWSNSKTIAFLEDHPKNKTTTSSSEDDKEVEHYKKIIELLSNSGRPTTTSTNDDEEGLPFVLPVMFVAPAEEGSYDDYHTCISVRAHMWKQELEMTHSKSGHSSKKKARQALQGLQEALKGIQTEMDFYPPLH